MDTQKGEYIPSRAWIVDLLISISQDLATINHLTERLIYLEKEIEEGNAEVLSERVKIDDLIHAYTTQRRNKFAIIKDNFKTNPKYLCAVKHQLLALELDLEVYQSLKDTKSFTSLYSTYNNLASLVSNYLGLELSDCWRCLGEDLLIKLNKNDNQ